ncbi:MAG: hypothetical protein JW701_03610 [Kosmotogaceae bacterium]|nr:hypothetical protein [Kosmotogaceae bacterium]
MRRMILMVVLLVVSLSTVAAVFMEEELTARQFGFSGKVHTAKIEIVKLGAELMVSDPETITFNEAGLVISRETEGVKTKYIYDDPGRLVKKEFIDGEGSVFQRVDIYYDVDFYDAVAFDESGIELERTRYWYDTDERTLVFSIQTETGVSTNTLYFDENGRKLESYSIVRENIPELETDVHIVVESTFFYDSYGSLNGERMIVRIRKEGKEQATEYRKRVDILSRDEKGNPVREFHRTEFLDGSNPPEEFIYSREFSYY